MALDILQGLVALAAVALLCIVIRDDFRLMIVRNRNATALVILYLLWAAFGGFAGWQGDLVAALALTSVAFVMWLLRMMGAGDVKLYFGIGLFIGYGHLSLYVILLFAASVLFLLVIKVSAKNTRIAGIWPKLREFSETGRAPYAVPMSLAAIPTILVRVFITS